MLSPTGPITPTVSGAPPLLKKLTHGQFSTPAPESPLMSSSQRTPSLFGGVAHHHHAGPGTPMTPTLLNYSKGMVAGSMDVGTMLLAQQSQYTQVIVTTLYHCIALHLLHYCDKIKHSLRSKYCCFGRIILANLSVDIFPTIFELRIELFTN